MAASSSAVERWTPRQICFCSEVADAVRRDGMPSIVFWDARPGLDKLTAAAAHMRTAGARTGEMLAAMPKHEHRTSDR